MHTKHHEPPDPNYKYEVRDLPIKDITKAVFWFYVLVVVTAPVAVVIMHFMGANTVLRKPGDHYELRQIPPDPHPLLQDMSTSHVDMANLRRHENAIIRGEAENPDTKRKQLPIDQAMEMEAAKYGQ